MSIQIEQLSEEEREEIINYGIRRSIVISISTIVTIMAGYLLGIVWQSIFFLFCFSALRKYAGGYHADTPIRCYFLSFITLFIALMGIKILQCDDNVGILIQTINLLIIIFLSPIDSVVHRLEYEEKKEYGTRAKKIALIYYVLYCILKKASIVYISTPIAVACSMVGISLIGGYINGNVKYMITTNGTILNNSIIEMFIKNDFLVSVSLDGISKIHNKNRAFASGKGSMDLVAKNTKKLLAHISNLNCQITLRREDIPFLEEAVTALWEMGVDKVYSNIVFDKNEIYQEKDYKELKFQAEILSDLMYQHLISGSKNIYGNIFDYMQNLHTRNYAINCFVWKEKIAAFASNGDAYSCYRLVGENDFLLGNVRQHDFTVFSKPFEKQKVAQCQNCYCQLYCGEGCPCENLVYNSDINIPAEEWCEKNKILFDISLRLYLKIKVNEPDLFRKLCKYWEENR